MRGAVLLYRAGRLIPPIYLALSDILVPRRPGERMMAGDAAARTRSRIMFVLPSFAGGGAERVALNLLSLTDRTDFEPHLVVLEPGGPLAHLVPSRHSRARAEQGAHAGCAAESSIRQGARDRQPAVIFSTFTHTSVPLLVSARIFERRPPRGTGSKPAVVEPVSHALARGLP